MRKTEERDTRNTIGKEESQRLRGLSFCDYLLSELRRGYLLENDEERYMARREKVYTFFKIPREIEKFVAYGFFQCADSFFFVFTFLPIRFLLAIWSLITRPIRSVMGLYRSKSGRILKPAEIVDLLKGIMLFLCCYAMGYIDTSVCYHIIKTQSTIKLYLFFNMLEIADRLMSAFGQDTLDALFWTATEPRGRKREHFGVIFHLLVASAYVGLHSTIVLLQALCFNVAINSDNKGLLTIVISNNFVELKGAVFKKFDRNNLLQISCSDVRERFHLCVLLLVVVIQTLKEYAWKAERFWILVPDCLLVLGTEVLIDWLKHAFITRFNDIPADAYRDYTILLASDLLTCKQKYAYSDHSDLVARRMGFIPLPLGVVMYRILSQSIQLNNSAAYLLAFLGFLCLISFRVLNGVIIMGKACDIIEMADKGRNRNESCSSECIEKPNPKPETLKVEVATSPIRGTSLPPPSNHSHNEVQKSLTPTLEKTTNFMSSNTTIPPRSDSLGFLETEIPKQDKSMEGDTNTTGAEEQVKDLPTSVDQADRIQPVTPSPEGSPEKLQLLKERKGMASSSSTNNNESSKMTQSQMALRTWESANNMEAINSVDEIYQYDRKQQQDILQAKPWEKDPHFFKQIKISALALLKMVMHARSGGTLEVMGLMLGKVDGPTMIVMDSFALPVEGTETRVNAQAQAYEYMTAYVEAAKQVSRQENVIGWYHSHPGYGCWLSGIDVSTQMLNQNYQEPFVAIVIDPIRTISSGKVNIGAFRTYPKGYKPPDEGPSEYQTIPLNKIEDFGVHCKQYYSLDISYFKSLLDKKLLDSLWNKYWVNTLSSSSLLTNADYMTRQIFDLSDKLENSETALGRAGLFGLDPQEKKTEDKLTRVTRDSCKTTMEALHGLMAQVIKDRLFNQIPHTPQV